MRWHKYSAPRRVCPSYDRPDGGLPDTLHYSSENCRHSQAHDFVYRYSLQSNELPIQLGLAWSVQRMAVAAIGVVTIGLLDVKEQLGIRSPPINDSAWRHDQRWLS